MANHRKHHKYSDHEGDPHSPRHGKWWAHMFWFMFDDASAWEKRSIEYRERYQALAPNGIDPATFQNRGAYGAYYGGQAIIKGGY